MANNPVQIVLGTNQFMRRPDAGGGGGAKDFFEARDGDFARHKRRLLSEVKTVSEQVAAGLVERVGYVKVKLHSAALAKSHRPLEVVFKPADFPLVGSGKLGELYFEVTPEALSKAGIAIERAEDVVTKRNKHEKLVVSSVRSEVGAIESIGLPDANDKRKFSADDAAAYMERHATGRYLSIELFVDESSLPSDDASNARPATRTALTKFRRELGKLTAAVSVSKLSSRWVTLHLTLVSFPQDLQGEELRAAIVKILTFLDASPLVREVTLAPVLKPAALEGAKALEGRGKLPAPTPQANYAVVGIVDGGVARTGALNAWRAGGIDYMDEDDQDRRHGTFIAGLLVNGAGFNPGQRFESRPCKFYDFDLYTSIESKFLDNYGQGFYTMMEQLDVELAQRSDHPRVINMSLTPDRTTDPMSYGQTASLLDELADRHDVVFVISAGNLTGTLVRTTWPTEATRALKAIASYPFAGYDRVLEPGESARNLTVGALECYDEHGATRPARYTRRGPAGAAGTKPDFVHVGGCLASNRPLISISPSGQLVGEDGTSYSAPMIAKTLALLDEEIEGYCSRELLLALMYHFAALPECLQHRDLASIAKDFGGFGVPAAVDDMLVTDDHAITLIFNDVLPAEQELSFDFTWPAALIQDGAIRGDVTLTLVYRPPLDGSHRSEFARVNLNAYLRQEVLQEDGTTKTKGRLTHDVSGLLEKDLITHGAKWWPVKQYQGRFKRLEGTINWRLVVDSIVRAAEPYPQGGVAFAMVLSISDPDKEAPVFSTTRRSLLAAGVNIQDVRTAARVRTHS